jgi:transposase
MRTIKRATYGLNKGKLEEVRAICRAYAAEKRYWLDVFSSAANQARIKTHRQVRDEAIQSGYQSPNGLQARMWKLALVDASETWDKYWQALFVGLRKSIAGNKTLDVLESNSDKQKGNGQCQRRYLYWLLKSYPNFVAALHGGIPVPKGFKVDNPMRLVRYLQKIVKRHRGKNPCVGNDRSFCLDANCYSIFEHSDTQYIKIMTLNKGKRLAIPLSGKTSISGNIRIVMDKKVVRIHTAVKLRQKHCFEDGSEEVAAIDSGHTEVVVDETGQVYGEDFGRTLTEASDRRNDKGKTRNKLHALEKKHRAAGNKNKADNIIRFNLGQEKQQKQTRKELEHIGNIINRSINGILRERKPAVLVSEDLRHSFSFDKPKAINRKLSAWVKGVVQDRIEFKAMAEGFRHEQVNPAYGSQTCPLCGFVDKRNRAGDRFKCLYPRCGYVGHADQVAASNYKRRVADPEITRYTPYREVKAILLQRFNRRLEAEGRTSSEVTVPGRTLEAVGSSLSTVDLVVKTEQPIFIPVRA